jgi:hypothetical protein
VDNLAAHEVDDRYNLQCKPLLRDYLNGLPFALEATTMPRWSAGPVKSTTSGRVVAKQMKPRESKCKQNGFHLLLFVFWNRDISEGYGGFK